MSAPMFLDSGGMLLWMLEPDQSDYEEWNRWYDREHVPALMDVPGFLAASRWEVNSVLHGTAPARYLAFYEIEALTVLGSETYHQNRASLGPSMQREWTVRMLGAVVRAAGGSYRIGETGVHGSSEGPSPALMLVGTDGTPESTRWRAEHLLPAIRAEHSVVAWRALTRDAGSPRIAGMMERAEAAAEVTLCAVENPATASKVWNAVPTPPDPDAFALGYTRILASSPSWTW